MTMYWISPLLLQIVVSTIIHALHAYPFPSSQAQIQCSTSPAKEKILKVTLEHAPPHTSNSPPWNSFSSSSSMTSSTGFRGFDVLRRQADCVDRLGPLPLGFAVQLDSPACAVDRLEVVHGHAYQFFFKSRYFSPGHLKTVNSAGVGVDGADAFVVAAAAPTTAPFPPSPTAGEYLFRIRCYYFKSGRVETDVDYSSTIKNPTSRRRRWLSTKRIIGGSDDVKEMKAILLSKLSASFPIIPAADDLMANVTLVKHFTHIVASTRRIVDLEKADSFLRNVMHALDNSVQHLESRRLQQMKGQIDDDDVNRLRRAGSPKRPSAAHQKKIVVILGVVLTALIVATSMMIVAVAKDRCRTSGGGGRASSAHRNIGTENDFFSICWRICPWRSFQHPAIGGKTAARPLPPLPRRPEARLDLPPAIASEKSWIEEHI